MEAVDTINSKAFYAEYHGHPVDALSHLVDRLRPGRKIIWLVGDSSLDNKVA